MLSRLTEKAWWTIPVVPVENCIEGSVYETLELSFFIKLVFKLWRRFATNSSAQMAVPGQSKMRENLSHPQALAQGRHLLMGIIQMLN